MLVPIKAQFLVRGTKKIGFLEKKFHFSNYFMKMSKSEFFDLSQLRFEAVLENY
jgi:hypothetical protein